jgi:hypothetical protein
VLALVLTLAPLAPLAQETLTEILPDGRVVEREVVRGEDGNAVSHGSYKVRYADGVEAARGRMKDGLRHAKWRFFHSSGKKSATGWYRTGLREKEWTYWDEDGEVDESESGVYEIARNEYETGGRRSAGELRHGQRHGQWTFWWEDGSLKATGTCVDGQLQSEWLFHHPGGVLDPHWVSGTYVDDERVGDLETLNPVELPPRGEAVRDGPQERHLEALSRGDGDLAEHAANELHQTIEGDPTAALALLEQLDPASPAELAFGADLVARHLATRWSGAAFAWSLEETPEGERANRLSILRWRTLDRITFEDPGFRLFTVPERFEGFDEETPRPLESIHPPLTDGSGGAVAAAFQGHSFAARSPLSPLRVALAQRDGSAAERAVADGLEWLRAHQAPDGSWSCEGFADGCDCIGLGRGENDVGTTGLALLAFLGAGNTPHVGPHAETVARAVRYLVDSYDTKRGVFGQRTFTYAYSHAIATMALSEAAGFTRSRAVREVAQHAVRRIGAWRTEGSGWRYEEGVDSDTSLTAWMIQALRSAELSGLDVDSAAFDGALQWIERVTNQETGRCGYDTRGSRSARIEHVNDHLIPDGEAMSGAALYCRILIGQRPSEHPILEQHAALLRKKLPEWDPSGPKTDLYYWYYGTYGMRQLNDSSSWAPWQKALERAALNHQRKDGHAAGSWDPIGPWGPWGGRLYSTAILTLCLEAPYRHPLVLAE